MYEFFDHTADLGLRIRAVDLDTLFVEAAEAMFAAIVEDLTSVEPVREIDIRIEGDDVEYLLFDWLRELLFEFEANQLLLGQFEASIRDNVLTAKARGEPIDRTRHQLEHEVKAITYHGLRVEETSEGWLAEVIVDI